MIGGIARRDARVACADGRPPGADRRAVGASQRGRARRQVVGSLVREAVDLLDTGQARVAEVVAGRRGRARVAEAGDPAALPAVDDRDRRARPVRVRRQAPAEDAASRSSGVRVVPGASARFGSFLERGVILMPSYVNIGARVGAQHDGRHLGDRRLVRADRRERAPVRRRRHRWRARAAAGRARDRRGRLPHRQPVHRRRRRAGGRGQRARRGLHPHRVDPGHRRADRAPRSAAASCPRTASPCRPARPRKFPGGEFGLPCVLIIKHLHEGERHDKGQLESILRDHGATV